MSSRSDKKNSIVALGAAGIGIGLIAYMLYTGGGSSGAGGGSGSGGGYVLPMTAAGGYTPTTTGGGSSSSGGFDVAGLLGSGTTTANAPSITGYDIAATVGTKKAISSSQNETLRALVSGADYQQLSQQQIGAYNQSLAAVLSSEDRTGGGSLQSAVNFMGIGSNAVGIAEIPNSTKISNAGSNLTSVIYNNGAYEVRDWRGNIVSSGSAGAYSPSSSGGGSGGGSSSVSKKESVNITADKATAIRGSFVTAVSSTGAMSYTATSSSGSKKTVTTGGSSGGGSSSSSGMSSGGYAQGGAVRSNTTSSKYTGKK